jgi:hypothetical protein
MTQKLTPFFRVFATTYPFHQFLKEECFKFTCRSLISSLRVMPGDTSFTT